MLQRSSTSRILLSGNLNRFTIRSSVTTHKIFITSKIHDTYSGAVYSRVNLTLDRMNKISNLVPVSNNLASTGNLVYIYNNPFSNERKPRRPSISRSSLAAESFESHNPNNSSEERRNDNDSGSSSSSSFNSEERDYLQPKPKLDEPPESPLLPYFVGYKGRSIQESGENFAVVAARMIESITLMNLQFLDSKMPYTEILEPFIMLVKLIRTMDVKQIAEIEDKLSEKFKSLTFLHEELKQLHNQTTWDVLSNAVVHAGTGPALITIKNWIKSKRLEGREAVNIISRIPKAAITPTAEYVQAFFVSIYHIIIYI